MKREMHKEMVTPPPPQQQKKKRGTKRYINGDAVSSTVRRNLFPASPQLEAVPEQVLAEPLPPHQSTTPLVPPLAEDELQKQ